VFERLNLGFQLSDVARRCRLVKDLLLDDCHFVVSSFLKIIHVIGVQHRTFRLYGFAPAL
jgi:hypothetical protein